MNFTCIECGEVKDESLARWGSVVTASSKAIVCKKCHSTQTYMRQLAQKIRVAPQDWMFCDDCDRTFSRYSTRGPYHTKCHICCPYCSSEEILAYSEISRS